MKKKCAAVMMIFLLGGLTACESPFSDRSAENELVIKTEPIERDAVSTQEGEAFGEHQENVREEVSGEALEEPPKKSIEEPVKESAEAGITARQAYVSVLERIYQEHSFPNGLDLGYDEISDISDNQFAIYDIDGDGKEELIVLWTTTVTAGMTEIVYDFDSTSNTVREELLEYPALDFYDNGIVEAGLSHNHGLAGDMDFWPYTLYQYDKNADTYIIAAEVDAWNKAFFESDFDGNPFPDEIDADGDGILYKISIEGKEKLADLEEYKQWRDSLVGGAGKVEIPFQKLTGENIAVSAQ